MTPASFVRAALPVACLITLAMPVSAQGLAAAASTAAAESAEPAERADASKAPLPAGEAVTIAVPGAGTFGGSVMMVTQVFKPPGEGQIGRASCRERV